LLLLLTILFGCDMAVPVASNESALPPLIVEQFDFVASDFNQNTFNSQRSAWQKRDYKSYGYVLSLANRHNSETPFEFYKCKVIIGEGKDPEVICLEGTPPEDLPSAYTIDGIYDHIFSVIEDLAVRVKENDEGFRVNIGYFLPNNIPDAVSIERMENGVYHSFCTIQIENFWLPPVTAEEVKTELYKFDRETFDQEYNLWKDIGIKNYRYAQYRKVNWLNESGNTAVAVITIQDGKGPHVEGGSLLEDYTIDGVFNFISSAVEASSASDLEFWLSYSSEYHIPATVAAFTPGEELSFKLLIILDSFVILSQAAE
jgi:hypothetical protein